MVNQATALLTEIEQARQAIPSPIDGESPHAMRRFHLGESRGRADNSDTDDGRQLDLRIELGRTRLPLEEAQVLRSGSVVLLDGLIGEPVAIVVGKRLIGRGEVVVIDGKIGVRVTERIDTNQE